MESKRFKRLIKDSSRLAVQNVEIGGVISSHILNALVRQQLVGIVEDELLTNDEVIDNAILIMCRQN